MLPILLPHEEAGDARITGFLASHTPIPNHRVTRSTKDRSRSWAVASICHRVVQAILGLMASSCPVIRQATRSARMASRTPRSVGSGVVTQPADDRDPVG